MRYAGIIYDDTAAAPGLSLTLFTQGCRFRCKGCHNADMWDYDGGYEFTEETVEKILKGLSKNRIIRNLCIMGGEPLSYDNFGPLLYLLEKVREEYGSTIKIFLWTGYTYEELQKAAEQGSNFETIFSHLDYLIDGRYEEDKRDITLKMRGSSNQRIFHIVKDSLIELFASNGSLGMKLDYSIEGEILVSNKLKRA